MLREKINAYLKKDYYPFHVPGHKRNLEILDESLPYQRDFTEIPGFDNLNDPQDFYKEMEEDLAKIYGVKSAIISTNGSTASNLASIRALSKQNKKILIGRNSHLSIFNAIEVFGLDFEYIRGIYNEEAMIVGIDLEDLEEKLKTFRPSLVLLTTPSFEGFFFDTKRALDLCHKYQALLVLDMAHGAHLHLFEEYKDRLTFDLAITSLHKTLSALTPASLVLINNKKIDEGEVRRNMAIFQTSSPSYVITQSIDDLIEKHDLFYPLRDRLKGNLKKVYELDLQNLEIPGGDKDLTRLLISTKNTNITGFDLERLLHEEKIDLEMALSSYVVLVTSIFDRDEGFDRLIKALKKIDKQLEKRSSENLTFEEVTPKKTLSISEALEREGQVLPLEEAANKISGQYIYAFPPEIPLIVPGEVFDGKIIRQIRKLEKAGANLSSPLNSIKVLK